MIHSKRLKIKNGVIRSVHVNGAGTATWVVKIDGVYVAVRGTVSNDTFVPNEKFKALVDAYKPVRKSYKVDNREVVKNWANTYDSEYFKKLNATPVYVNYQGETRKLYKKGESRGVISFHGKDVYGTWDENLNFISRKKNK